MIKKYFIIILVLTGISSSGFAIAQDSVASSPDTVGAVTEESLGLLATNPLPSEDAWRITFNKVFWALLLIVIVWIGSRYLIRIFERIGLKYYRYRLLVKRFIPIFRILVWSLVVYFIIANILAPPWATLLALLASVGIAVGFAAQDILKNIFGGIMILFDQPFQVGDKVEIGQYYGEVVFAAYCRNHPQLRWPDAQRLEIHCQAEKVTKSMDVFKDVHIQYVAAE